MAARPSSRPLATAVTALLVLGGCATPVASGTSSGTSSTPGSASGTSSGTSTATTTAGLFDASLVHTIDLQVDDAAVDEAVSTYLSTGEKVWVHGSVTVDGTTYPDVGLRLKGNSTLRDVDEDTAVQDLPWLVRVDKWVDGQSVDGVTRFVLRANRTASSLNELVALTLLADAGVPASRVGVARVSADGGEASLHAVVEGMDDAWTDATFDEDTILYKSDVDGDWSDRGSDPAAYQEAFDVEAGTEDWQPVADLMQLLDDASDEQLEAELPERLDVEAFARYLALEDLMDNDDDIDGPGSNSYLAYDESTGVFTVVAWDHNLTFGVTNRPGGQGAQGGAGDGGGQAGGRGGQGGGQGGGGGSRSSNPLADRFHAIAAFEALYDAATDELRAQLFTSGVLADTVDAWATTIAAGAGDLVDAATLASEAETITAYAGTE